MLVGFLISNNYICEGIVSFWSLLLWCFISIVYTVLLVATFLAVSKVFMP